MAKPRIDILVIKHRDVYRVGFTTAFAAVLQEPALPHQHLLAQNKHLLVTLKIVRPTEYLQYETVHPMSQTKVWRENWRSQFRSGIVALAVL